MLFLWAGTPPTPAANSICISVDGLRFLISVGLRAILLFLWIRKKVFSEDMSFPSTCLISVFGSKTVIFRTLPGVVSRIAECQMLSGTWCHFRVSPPIYSCPSIKKCINACQISTVLIKGWRVMCNEVRLQLPVKFPKNILATWVSEESIR